MGADIFIGRNLVIATMHGKERLIGPLLSSLEVRSSVPDYFNTDAFGSFSGEIKREGTALETARIKCKAAMDQTGADLAVASEGSFGPYPEAFGLAANEEYLLLLDRKHDLEIIAKEFSTETNFGGKACEGWEEVKEFSSASGFPDHGIIIRENKESLNMTKGIRNLSQLKLAYEHFKNDNGRVWIETDMRAMHNPTRGKVIKAAAKKIVDRCKTPCPKCKLPGFGPTDVCRGLRCAQCKMPTKGIKAHIFSCVSCSFIQEERVRGAKVQDPMYCDFCNP